LAAAPIANGRPAPYQTGDIAAVRVIPPSGGGAQAHAYATTREAGHQRRFSFRAIAPLALP
jgi:hypothetical protein